MFLLNILKSSFICVFVFIFQDDSIVHIRMLCEKEKISKPCNKSKKSKKSMKSKKSKKIKEQ